MRPATSVVLRLLLALIAASRAPGAQPYKDPSQPVEVRVRDLIGRMTVQEKFWQLWMMPGDLGNDPSRYASGIFGLQVRDPRPDTSAERRAQSPADAARAMAGRINA